MKNHTAIRIRGARTNNLKDLDLDIPLGKITCISGPSGSGKSSLAFHTLMMESKRRFMNSFPNDVKFFWDVPNTVDVDEIFPVLPVWGLPQNNPVVGSRVVVSDLLGVFEKIQKLYFWIGKRVCPDHRVPYIKETLFERVERFVKSGEGVIHAFLSKKEYLDSFDRSEFPQRSLSDEFEVNSFNEDDDYFEIFRLKANKASSIDKKLKSFTKEFKVLFLLIEGELIEVQLKDLELSCPKCTFELPKSFTLQDMSPYNALGACGKCSGHGMVLEYDRNKLVKYPHLSIKEGAISFIHYKRFEHHAPLMRKLLKKKGHDLSAPFSELDESVWTDLFEGGEGFPGFQSLFDFLATKRYKPTVRIFIRSLQSEYLCLRCEGARVSKVSQGILIKKNSYKDILLMRVNDCLDFLKGLSSLVEKHPEKKKVKKIYTEIITSLECAKDLGLGNIVLNKKAKKLSASEYQRSILVKYLSFNGSGSLFVLDEPSLTLSANEIKMLLKYLTGLKKQGNTVLVVEHNEFIISSADHSIVMGPKAGHEGGKILFEGRTKKKKLSSYKGIKTKSFKENIEVKSLELEGFSPKDFKIPLNQITWVHGESGLGKSEYLIDGLGGLLYKECYQEKLHYNEIKYKKLKNPKEFKDVFVLTASANKVSSRSSVGTILGLTQIIRKHYSKLPVSKSLNLKDGHFSPNSDLGKCSSCEGRGEKVVDMQFLEDLKFPCEDCKGMKLKPFYATISDGNFSFYDSIHRPMNEILPHLKLTPKMKRLWEYVEILNLGYLSLDRSLTSLSGGERQRLNLLSTLQKDVSDSLLIFENLSFGLSEAELPKICEFLGKLSVKSNTVLVIDENLIFQDYADFEVKF